MSARALQLREGIAPTRDRLTTTVFMAALVHGVIIVGVTFGSVRHDSAGAPGLEVLIVSEDVPEAQRNDTATYLAQRTVQETVDTGCSCAGARARAASSRWDLHCCGQRRHSEDLGGAGAVAGVRSGQVGIGLDCSAD